MLVQIVGTDCRIDGASRVNLGQAAKITSLLRRAGRTFDLPNAISIAEYGPRLLT
jgi:hypothetical protein